MRQIEDFLVCPKCHNKLQHLQDSLVCSGCCAGYDLTDGIPIMFSSRKKAGGRISSFENEDEDIDKDYIINYYSQITDILDAQYGRFIKFMNCGYVPNENRQYSTVDLYSEKLERNSIKLLLEVVGQIDCSGKDIIEIGCGRGGNGYYLNRFFTPRLIIGIDICLANIISCCKMKIANAAYCVADAELLPFASESFDIALNIESSFHYPNLTDFYQNVYRVLKQDGYFFYADVLPIQKFREIEILFSSIGFQIVRSQDITSNVLLSFEKMAGGNVGVNEQRLKKILALEDSRNYKHMKRGEAEYRIYTARKHSEVAKID
ncbi:methyltransferase domain-containing protein [Hydrogeniiclostridium mannosilyticum]|uniref:methyltransferase domain-containing protein n=1 Tax=Hydrogeniiclostridium mannosilyticum TaxID=2764322 RepID=UPI00399A8019